MFFKWAEGESDKQQSSYSRVPDRYDVREEHHETEQVAEPRTHESLQRYHDNGQNHLGQEQSLGEAVQLQVQEADLSGRDKGKRVISNLLSI